MMKSVPCTVTEQHNHQQQCMYSIVGNTTGLLPVEVQDEYMVASCKIQPHPSGSEGNCEHLHITVL